MGEMPGMYSVQPERVYITEWALRDERAQPRLRRLAAALGQPDPPVLTAAELAEVARERGWGDEWRSRTGAVRTPADPDIVLNAFVFDEEELKERLAEHPELRQWLLAGQSAVTLRDSRNHLRGQNAICQTALEMHCAFGCLHACDYCHIGSLFNIMTNLEALAEHFRVTIAENRWCRLWKFDNMTDTIALEPEYGASEIMVNLFAKQHDAFLLLYTKSDNVDHLLGLDHRGQTLISWSLASDTPSRLIEKKTPPMRARIAAMRRCQVAGYRVRVRLSPISPVVNWQQEATEMLEALLAEVQPEVITMDVLGWMNARQMIEAIDIDLLDPQFREFVVQQSEPVPGPHRKHLFNHEMRRLIFRHYLTELHRLSPRTPVSLCMETVEMWREFGPEMGMQPGHYACCCGPTSVPGHPLL
jgi:spore photoproduct lyase